MLFVLGDALGSELVGTQTFAGHAAAYLFTGSVALLQEWDRWQALNLPDMLKTVSHAGCSVYESVRLRGRVMLLDIIF